MTKHILCAVDLTHDADARALLVQSGRLAELYRAPGLHQQGAGVGSPGAWRNSTGRV